MFESRDTVPLIEKNNRRDAESEETNGKETIDAHALETYLRFNNCARSKFKPAIESMIFIFQGRAARVDVVVFFVLLLFLWLVVLFYFSY